MTRDKGKMFIFTAPSGAGKTTIVQHVLQKFPFLGFSVSATTRTKREKELDGRDYYFLSKEEFDRKISEGAFAEWEEVYTGLFYGTLHKEIERVWQEGRHLVFDIDVQGALRLKKLFGHRCMSIFVKPPSTEVLVQRLTARNTETPENLAKRIAKMKEENQFENHFDMVLVNDILPIACTEAEHIVQTFVFGIDQS
ncbi:MAG: guanylate kinase [Saprospiraceae bacterium]|nr:guanylate kinase [Saprospiraceae bacterium]